MTRLHPFKIFATSTVAFAMTATMAAAIDINTGGESGAYHSTFCPNLVGQLSSIGRTGECVTSTGSGDNMRRVARNPAELGYGQLDVFALEAERFGGRKAFDIIRTDDVRECVFAVTRNKRFTNFGEIAVNADQLRFVLPPKSSGSAKTFDYLRRIDPEGLGQARDIVNMESTDAAIEDALKDESSVTFFVQFPDPRNERFRRIRQLSGHIVPVVDSIILRQEVDGRTVYYAQETSISQLKWLNLGQRVVTVCTPLVLFTGAASRIENRDARARHRQTILSIRAMDRKDLVPEQSPIARILARTRELSSRARYHFQELSLNARERARPLLERLYRGANHLVRLMIVKARPPEYRAEDGRFSPGDDAGRDNNL